MAGIKLSAKVQEEIAFMEHMLLQCGSLTRKIDRTLRNSTDVMAAGSRAGAFSSVRDSHVRSR